MEIIWDKLEKRDYQIKIFEVAKYQNTLIVLPTGLGKTTIALMLVEYKLNKEKGSKALVLAPTRPLVEQHKNFFQEFAKGYFIEVTGRDRPEQREKLYKRGEVIFATPQTILNDIYENRINLLDFSIIIFDEAHHATGNYAYVPIAKKYVEENPKAHIVGLTATPGNSVEKILEVCRNLFIKHIEYRFEYFKDVRPYIKEKLFRTIEVNLPEEYLTISLKISNITKEILKELSEKYGVNITEDKLKIKNLLGYQAKYAKENPSIAIRIAALIKLYHLNYLLTSQHTRLFKEYLEELLVDDSKSSQLIIENKNFREIYRLGISLKGHPKIVKLLELLEKNRDKTFIIFVQLTKTAEIIKEELINRGFRVEIFAGQKVMSQRKQREIINKFELGFYNGIIATSIGEEGLHIPSVDVAYFYEPTPSVLRNIQRRGRVGRTKIGYVYILYSKNSPDEIYFWSTLKKEKKLVKMLKEVESILKYE